MRPLGVFLLGSGNTQDAADLVVAPMAGHQHAQQPLRIKPVRLCASRSAADEDAGGLHDDVVDPVRDQKPVQPEAVRPCLEAGGDRDRFAKARFSACAMRRNKAEQPCRVARLQAMKNEFLDAGQAHGDKPDRPTEFERNIDSRISGIVDGSHDQLHGHEGPRHYPRSPAS